MESVGLQYGADEFVEGPVNPADPSRYTSPKSGGSIYAADNFYDAASGTWYSPSAASGNYAQPTAPGGNYHNVNHPSHMSQQGGGGHEHYGMSPHMEAPHMSTTPQPLPLPPMSSFRGSSNGPTQTTNPALYNPTLSHQQHNLQNDTLVGKALQTVINEPR
jgi:hypothetical protein